MSNENLTISNYYPISVTKYFRSIAESILGHTTENPRFARNYTEFSELAQRRMDITKLCLILEQRNGRFTDSGSHQFFDRKDVSFFLLKHVPVDDFEQEDLAYQEAYQALEKMNKIFWEARRQYACNDMMQYYEPESLSYEEVGPELENSFGLYVSLTFSVPANQFFYASNTDS